MIDAADSATINATHATSPQLIRQVPYDPFKDFEPIVLLVTSPVLAAASISLGITNSKDLVAAAKANPGKLTYGSGGVGLVSHLSVEIFKSRGRIRQVRQGNQGDRRARRLSTGIILRTMAIRLWTDIHLQSAR